MIISKKVLCKWHDMEEGTFQDKPYWTAYVFPFKDDGTVSIKQLTLKVDKESVNDLRKLKMGEKVELEVGMYIKESEINKLRIYKCLPSVLDYSELIE